MGAALETGVPPSTKPSFKTRFKAWWEGVDLNEPPAEAQPAEPVRKSWAACAARYMK